MSSRNFIWKQEWDTSAYLWELWKSKISLYSCRKLGACHLSQRPQSGVHTGIPIGALSQARQLTNLKPFPENSKIVYMIHSYFPPLRECWELEIFSWYWHTARKGSRYGGWNSIHLPERLLYFLLVLCFSGMLPLLSNFRVSTKEIRSICSCLHGGMEA